MGTAIETAPARASRARTLALAFGCAVALTLALRALAVPAIAMDGVVFVDILVRADGAFPLYYHALYLPLAALVEHVVGAGRSIDALLWLSALCGVGALAITSLALEREFGPRPALLAACAFAASPAFWFMSANIEVHATQALGGAVALAAGVFASRRSTASAAWILFAALLFATLVHNSNALLALGAALMAARGSDGRRTLARALRLAAVTMAAAALGLYLDHLALGTVGVPKVHSRLDRLVFSHALAPTLSFYASEFLYAWFPLLLLACAFVPRSRDAWRAALPYIVGAAPVWLTFLATCNISFGGYFSAGAVFVLGAALSARRADSIVPTVERRWIGRLSSMVFVSACAIGIGLGIADTHSPERLDLARIGDERCAIARATLPNGGLFVSLDPTLQYVSGRTADLDELPIALALHAVLEERVSREFALETLGVQVERAAASGRALAFNMSWRLLAEQLPQVAHFHELLLERCEQHYRFEARDALGLPFLVGTPR